MKKKTNVEDVLHGNSKFDSTSQNILNYHNN